MFWKKFGEFFGGDKRAVIGLGWVGRFILKIGDERMVEGRGYFKFFLFV